MRSVVVGKRTAICDMLGAIHLGDDEAAVSRLMGITDRGCQSSCDVRESRQTGPVPRPETVVPKPGLTRAGESGHELPLVLGEKVEGDTSGSHD